MYCSASNSTSVMRPPAEGGFHLSARRPLDYKRLRLRTAVLPRDGAEHLVTLAKNCLAFAQVREDLRELHVEAIPTAGIVRGTPRAVVKNGFGQGLVTLKVL